MMLRFFRGSATRDNGNSSSEIPSPSLSSSSTLSSSTSLPLVTGPARPIRFLYCDDKGKFRVDPEALATLFKDPISVVSVCGRARQSKSFILNQLLGRSSGFQVASSQKPCTKGLWLRSVPQFPMLENPFAQILKTFETISLCIQTQLSSLTDIPLQMLPFSSLNQQPILSLSSTKDKASQPVTKEELGRATWTFLHTLAAQYPEHPTRQQKKDVKELMAILSRMYPCKECADHFKEVLRSNPVQAGSQAEFSQWLCHVHNVVNRSLGKPVFLCDRVDARWGKLDCEKRMCDLQGTTSFGEDL